MYLIDSEDEIPGQRGQDVNFSQASWLISQKSF